MFWERKNARVLLGSLLYRGVTDGLATDGDDTLWDTEKVVHHFKTQYLSAVHRRVPGVDIEELNERLKPINVLVNSIMGVPPERWGMIAKELGKQYRHEKTLRSALTDPQLVDIFAGIYTTTPRLLPGAWSTIRQFYFTGQPLVMVTHANKDWTYLKLKKSRLLPYFSHIEIVDETQPCKTFKDWKRAAQKAGMQPERSMGMGDSLTHDILPADKAGYRLLVWLPSKWGKLNSKGVKMPMGTIELPGIRYVHPALTSLEDAPATT